MAEIPDHLVPTDGLTNSLIRYAGLDAPSDDGDVIHRFDMFDEDRHRIGTFEIETPPADGGSVDRMIGDAHRRMTDILRQWLYTTDKLRQHYEGQ